MGLCKQQVDTGNSWNIFPLVKLQCAQNWTCASCVIRNRKPYSCQTHCANQHWWGSLGWASSCWKVMKRVCSAIRTAVGIKGLLSCPKLKGKSTWSWLTSSCSLNNTRRNYFQTNSCFFFGTFKCIQWKPGKGNIISTLKPQFYMYLFFFLNEDFSLAFPLSLSLSLCHTPTICSSQY